MFSPSVAPFVSQDTRTYHVKYRYQQRAEATGFFRLVLMATSMSAMPSIALLEPFAVDPSFLMVQKGVSFTISVVQEGPGPCCRNHDEFLPALAPLSPGVSKRVRRGMVLADPVACVAGES